MTHNNLKVQYLQTIKHTFCYVLLWFGNGQFYATYNVSLANSQLEKLELLCSEDTPAAPWLLILLTSSYWIQSQNKTKPNLKICPNFKFLNFEKKKKK